MLNRVKGAWKSLRALLRKDDVEGELDEELAFHIEMETEKNIRAGLSPAEARRTALVSFRGVERTKEEVRAARRVSVLEVLGRDVSMAFHMIRRSPGAAAAVVLTLGVGIGAATVIFSVVDAAVLRPLPWSDPGRLVEVRETTPQGAPFSVSEPDYLDFKAGSHFLSRMAAFRGASPSLTGRGEPERVPALAVTHTLFPLLGAKAALGRTFNAEEDRPGEGHVAVLSYGLWQRRFGGDPGIVGRTIELDDEPYVVTGVMPADFTFMGTQLWIPLAPDARSDRTDHWLNVVGRLAPGATVRQAQAELASVSSSLAKTYPAMSGWSVEVRSLKDLFVGPEFRQASVLLVGAVALLLLMACANAANLLLARAVTRHRELGIRAALGAGRLRLLRQLLMESGILAVAGTGLGLLLAWWATTAIRAAAPGAIPRVENVTVNLRVLAFAAALALLTALLSGVFPALQAARTDAAAQLRDGGRTGVSRGQRRLRDGLVVTQVSMAVVLLLGAGMLLRSFVRLEGVDPGFRIRHIWGVPIHLPASRYPRGDQQYFAFRDILARVRAIPGVTSAAAGLVDPFSGFNAVNDVTPAERVGQVSEAGYMQARWRNVSVGYFETMGVPLLRGRTFTTQDRYDTPLVMIVTRTAAERLWPGEDAVGKRLFWGGTDGKPRTVIGVVADVQDVALDADPAPLVFMPDRQVVLPMTTLLVRTGADVPGLAAAIRHAVWDVDPSLAVPDVRPLLQNRAAALAGPRFNALLLAAFAAVSLLLAAVGLYGLLAFLVARRTRELGVRRALGADTATVARMVLRRAVVLAGTGIAVGLAIAAALARFVASLLYHTSPTDTLTYVAVPALLLLVAAIAAWLPARRATRVSPLIALRSD